MLAALALFLPQIVFAQINSTESGNEEIPILETETETFSSLTLWIPEIMIKGESYKGLIVSDQHDGMTVGLTTSDPTVVDASKSVSIFKNENHGIFEITPIEEGTATIYASIDGEIASSETTIYSANTIPKKLDFILPTTNTKADKVQTIVITTNENGVPTPVLEDTRVSLSSTKSIIVPAAVTIPAGKHYASFEIVAYGTGDIIGSSRGLDIATTTIVREQEQVEVKVAISPLIALEDSTVIAYVWMEKDGMPFKPLNVVDTFIASENFESVRVFENKDISHYGDSLKSVPMVDGLAKYTLITGSEGTATITATVTGYGSAQTKVIVGPAGDDADELTTLERKELQPNMAMIFVNPPITDEKTFGTVALYHINKTKTITNIIGEDGTPTIEETEEVDFIVPMRMDGRTLSVSASGELNMPQTLSLVEGLNAQEFGTSNRHVAEFEIESFRQGDYDVFVSGAGLERTQTSFTTESQYKQIGNLNITPIPTLPGIDQPIAMISLLDSNGNLVNVKETLGSFEVLINTKNGQETITIGNTNSKLIKSDISSKMTLSVSANSYSPEELEITPGLVTDTIHFDIPTYVHATEEFPYYMHEVDVFGTPIKMTKPISLTSTAGLSELNNMLTASTSGSGKLSVLSDFGAYESDIESFLNELTLDFNTPEERTKLDEPFDMNIISNIQNLEWNIDSPFSVQKKQDDTFEILPDKEGIHTVTFTANKLGFKPITKTVDFNVEKIVDINVKAISNDDNKDIAITQTLNEREFITPYSTELKPQTVELIFPKEYSIQGKNYVLQSIHQNDSEFKGNLVNGLISEDTNINAIYERYVRIDIQGATGNDFYAYGEEVTLTVEPRDKVSFLIRDVFDKWEGVNLENKDKVTFIANEDLTGSVVLREDYTGIGGIIGLIATAAILVAAKKQSKENPLFKIMIYLKKIKAMNISLPIPKSLPKGITKTKSKKPKDKPKESQVDF